MSGGPRDLLVTRRVLKSLDSVQPDLRPLAVGLHWAMSALKANWAALHRFPPDGARNKPELLLGTPSTSDGALLDFLADEIVPDWLASLAVKAAASSRAVVANHQSSRDMPSMPCSALCVPLLDQDGRTPIGTLTLMCNDLKRVWTADEQQLLATTGPLLGLHLTKHRLADQAVLLQGARAAEPKERAASMAEHAAKVVHDMRGVQARGAAGRTDLASDGF